MASRRAIPCCWAILVPRTNMAFSCCIWVQPAAGDAGGALGAALAATYDHHKLPRAVRTNSDAMKGSYLGPVFEDADIEQRLVKMGAKVHRIANDDETVAITAKALADEKAIGWFQGRMEFGPRALGGRSIIGDARSPAMQKNLNLKVKYRESFRPFAPSVLREDVAEWFDYSTDSPYMLMVAPVNDNKTIPMTAEQEKLFGIEKTECAALANSGGHTRGLFRTHPDRA